MRIPKELQLDAAKEFWKRNAPLMASDGRLTDATRDGFVLLCQMWASYVGGELAGLDANKIVALSKQVQNLMGAFGMTPASRKRLKLDEKKQNLGDVLNQALGGDDANAA